MQNVATLTNALNCSGKFRVFEDRADATPSTSFSNETPSTSFSNETPSTSFNNTSVESCYSGIRICPLQSTVSEQSSGYPLAHPRILYKYSNDGEYLSKSIAKPNKVNIDPFSTPTGGRKRLSSTMAFHKDLGGRSKTGT